MYVSVGVVIILTIAGGDGDLGTILCQECIGSNIAIGSSDHCHAAIGVNVMTACGNVTCSIDGQSTLLVALTLIVLVGNLVERYIALRIAACMGGDGDQAVGNRQIPAHNIACIGSQCNYTVRSGNILFHSNAACSFHSNGTAGSVCTTVGSEGAAEGSVTAQCLQSYRAVGSRCISGYSDRVRCIYSDGTACHLEVAVDGELAGNGISGVTVLDSDGNSAVCNSQILAAVVTVFGNQRYGTVCEGVGFVHTGRFAIFLTHVVPVIQNNGTIRVDQNLSAVACLDGIQVDLAFLNRIGIQIIDQITAGIQFLEGVGKQGEFAAIDDQIVTVDISVLREDSQAAALHDLGQRFNVGIALRLIGLCIALCSVVQIDIARNHIIVFLVLDVKLTGCAGLQHIGRSTHICRADDGNIAGLGDQIIVAAIVIGEDAVGILHSNGQISICTDILDGVVHSLERNDLLRCHIVFIHGDYAAVRADPVSGAGCAGFAVCLGEGVEVAQLLTVFIHNDFNQHNLIIAVLHGVGDLVLRQIGIDGAVRIVHSTCVEVVVQIIILKTVDGAVGIQCCTVAGITEVTGSLFIDLRPGPGHILVGIGNGSAVVVTALHILCHPVSQLLQPHGIAALDSSGNGVFIGVAGAVHQVGHIGHFVGLIYGTVEYRCEYALAILHGLGDTQNLAAILCGEPDGLGNLVTGAAAYQVIAGQADFTHTDTVHLADEGDGGGTAFGLSAGTQNQNAMVQIACSGVNDLVTQEDLRSIAGVVLSAGILGFLPGRNGGCTAAGPEITYNVVTVLVVVLQLDTIPVVQGVGVSVDNQFHTLIVIIVDSLLSRCCIAVLCIVAVNRAAQLGVVGSLFAGRLSILTNNINHSLQIIGIAVLYHGMTVDCVGGALLIRSSGAQIAGIHICCDHGLAVSQFDAADITGGNGAEFRFRTVYHLGGIFCNTNQITLQVLCTTVEVVEAAFRGSLEQFGSGVPKVIADSGNIGVDQNLTGFHRFILNGQLVAISFCIIIGTVDLVYIDVLLVRLVTGTAGAVLCRHGNGGGSQSCIGNFQPVLIEVIGSGGIPLPVGLVNKFAEGKSVAGIGGLGSAVQAAALDGNIRDGVGSAVHSPVDTGEVVISILQYGVGVTLAEGNRIQRAASVAHIDDVHCFVGIAVPDVQLAFAVIDFRGQAGDVHEVFEHILITCIKSQVVQMGCGSGSGIIGSIIKLCFQVSNTVTQSDGTDAVILIPYQQLVAVQFFLIAAAAYCGISGAIGRLIRAENIELNGVILLLSCAVIMDHQVNILVALQVGQIGIAAFNIVEGSSLHCLHELQGVLYVVTVLIQSAVGETDTDGAVEEALTLIQPGGLDGAHEHLVGVILLYIQSAVFQVDGNTLLQTDADNFAVSVPLEHILTHVQGNTFFLDPGNAAVLIQVEDRTVGKQVAVGAAGGIIVLEVTVQDISAGDGHISTQCHGFISDVTQCAGNGNGNHIGILQLVDTAALFQGQIHTAGSGGYIADVGGDTCCILGSAGGGQFFLGIHEFTLDRSQCEPNITGSIQHQITGGVFIHEYPAINDCITGTDGSSAGDMQLVCPQRCHRSACSKGGYTLYAGEAAACALTLPQEGDGAGGRCQHAGQMHIALAGVLHGDVGTVGHIPVIARGSAVGTGTDITGVFGGNSVDGDAVIRGVGNGHLGQHILIVDGETTNVPEITACQCAVRGTVDLYKQVAGKCIGQIPEDYGISVDRPCRVLVGDTHCANQAVVGAVLGNIHMDTGSCVTQIQLCTILHGDLAVIGNALAAVFVLDDGAAGLADIADTVLVQLQGIDHQLGTLEQEAIHHIGGGNGIQIQVTGGIAGAQCIQLHEAADVDIFILIVGTVGCEDGCLVMGGHIDIPHIYGGVQIRIHTGNGIDSGTQGRTLCVGVGIDVQLAGEGNDINISAFDVSCFLVLFTQIDRCIQIHSQSHIGVRLNAQTGALCGCEGSCLILGCVGQEADGVVTVGEAGFALNIDCGIGIDLGGGIDSTQGYQTAGSNLAAGLNIVQVAATGDDLNIAEVCSEAGAVSHSGGEGTLQQVVSIDTGAGEEAAAVCDSLCGHFCLGQGLCLNALVSIQSCVDFHIGGEAQEVESVGHIHIDAEADACTGYITGCLAVVLCRDDDITTGGNNGCVALDVGIGVIPACSGQLGGGNVTQSNIDALDNHRLCRTDVVCQDVHIAAGSDLAAVDAGLGNLILFCLACCSSCTVRLVGHGALADHSFCIDAAAIHKTHRSGGSAACVCLGVVVCVHIHSIADCQINALDGSLDDVIGIGGGIHGADGDTVDVHTGICSGVGIGVAIGQNPGDTCFQLAGAAELCGVGGVDGCTCGVHRNIQQGYICALLGAGGAGNGFRTSPLTILGRIMVNGGIDIQLTLDTGGLSIAARIVVGDLCILGKLQDCVGNIHTQAAQSKTDVAAQAFCLGITLAVYGHIDAFTIRDAGDGQLAAAAELGIAGGGSIGIRSVHIAGNTGNRDGCALGRLCGAGVGFGSVVGGNADILCGQASAVGIHDGLEDAVGVGLGNHHAECNDIGLQVILGNTGSCGCAAGCIHCQLGCVEACIVCLGTYSKACICQSGIGIDGQSGNNCAAAAFTAAGHNGICAKVFGQVCAVIELGVYGNILFCGKVHAADQSLLGAGQASLDHIDGQAQTLNLQNGTVELSQCLCGTIDTDKDRTIRNSIVAWVSLPVAADCHITGTGNTGSDGGSHVGVRLIGASIGQICIHTVGSTGGVGMGIVGILYDDPLGLDASAVLSAGIKGTVGAGMNHSQCHGYQAQIRAVDDIAHSIGSAVAQDLQCAGQFQLGIVDQCIVGSIKFCSNRVQFCIHSINAHTVTVGIKTGGHNALRAGKTGVFGIGGSSVVHIGDNTDGVCKQIHIADAGVLLCLGNSNHHIALQVHSACAEDRCIDLGICQNLAGGSHSHITICMERAVLSVGTGTGDTGCCAGGIHRNSGVYFHIAAGDLHAAGSGVDISSGDGRILVIDVDRTNLGSVTDGKFSIKLTCCHSNTHHNAQGDRTDRSSLNGCLRGGFAGAADGYCAVGGFNILVQVADTDVGTVGGISQCSCHIGRSGNTACSSRIHECLCHVGELASQQSGAFILCSLGVIHPDSQREYMEIAGGSALDGVCTEAAGYIHSAVGIYLGYLLILQPCKARGHVGSDGACGHIGQQSVGSCHTVGIDCQGSSIQSTAGADDLCVVGTVVQGDADIHGNGHGTCCTGNTDDQRLGFIGSCLGACIDGDGTGIDIGTGHVDDGTVVRADVANGYGSTDTHCAAHKRSGEHFGIAVQVSLDGQCTGDIHICLADSCNVVAQVEAKDHQAIDCNRAAADEDGIDGGTGIAFSRNRQGCCLHRTLGVCGGACIIGGAVGSGAHIGLCVEQVDGDEHRGIHGNCAACTGDVACHCAGLNIMSDADGCILRSDGNGLSDEAAGGSLVDSCADTGIHCNCAACNGCHGHGSLGDSSGGNVDLGKGIGIDVCLACNGCTDVALVVNHADGNIDTHDTGAHTDVDGENVAVVHAGFHIQFGCLGNITQKVCAYIAEHGHHGAADANARNTAASGQGDQTDGIGFTVFDTPVIQFAVNVFIFTLQHFQLLGSLAAACVGGDGDLTVGIQLCSGYSLAVYGLFAFHQRGDIGIEHCNSQADANARNAGTGNGAGNDVGIEHVVCRHQDITGSGDLGACADQSHGCVLDTRCGQFGTHGDGAGSFCVLCIIEGVGCVALVIDLDRIGVRIGDQQADFILTVSCIIEGRGFSGGILLILQSLYLLPGNLGVAAVGKDIEVLAAVELVKSDFHKCLVLQLEELCLAFSFLRCLFPGLGLVHGNGSVAVAVLDIDGTGIFGLAVLAEVLIVVLLTVSILDRADGSDGHVFGIVAGTQSCGYLCIGIHAGVQSIGSIAAQYIANNNSGKGCAHSCHAGTGDGNCNVHHIPVGGGQCTDILAFDHVLAAQGAVNGVEADADQGSDAHGYSTGTGKTGNGAYQQVVVSTKHIHITGGVNLNIIAGVGLGNDLSVNHFDGTADTYGAAAGQAVGAADHGFAGSSNDVHIAAQLIFLGADLGTVAQICVGLILEVGDDCNCADAHIACACHAGSNVVKVAVCSSLNIDALCQNGAAQNGVGGVVEDQNIDITGNAYVARCANGDTQQEHQVFVSEILILLLAQACDNGHDAVSSDGTAGSHGSFHRLQIDHGCHCGTHAHIAGSAERTCQVQKERVIVSFHADIAGVTFHRIGVGVGAGCGNGDIVAYGSLDSILHSQGADHAANADVGGRCTGDGNQNDVFHGSCTDGNASAALIPVGNLDAVAIGAAGGGNFGIVTHVGSNVVQEYRSGHGCAHGHIAAGTDCACHDIVAGIQMGDHTCGVAALQGDELIAAAIHQFCTNVAFTDGDGQVAADGHIGTACTGKQNADQQVFAGGLYQGCAIGCNDGSTGSNSCDDIPHQDCHAEHCADTCGVAVGCSQSCGEDPGITVGGDAGILVTLQSDLLTYQSEGLGFGNQHISQACHTGAAGSNTCTDHSNDQLFHILGIHTDAAVGAGNGGNQIGGNGCVAVFGIECTDPGDGLTQGYHGVQAHAAAYSTGGGRECSSNQQQPVITQCIHIDIAGSQNGGAVIHDGVGLVLHDDHIQHACAGNGAAGGSSACCCEVHEIGVGGGLLSECRIGSIHHNFAGLVQGNTNQDGGITHGCGGHVVIGDGCRVQAHTCGSGADRQGAADETGVGIGLSSDLHITAGSNGAVVADHGADRIGEHSHGQRTCSGYGGAAAGDCACQCFHVVVGGRQEVHQIDGIQEIIRIQIDGNGVSLGVGILLDIDDTLFLGGCGAAVGTAGIGDQCAQTLSKLEITHIHTELLGFHSQCLAADGGVVTDLCGDCIPAEYQRNACAHTYGGTTGDGDCACADSQLGLIVGRQLDVACGTDCLTGNAVLIEDGLSGCLGNQDGQGAADSSGAAGTGNATCQCLCTQSATVLVVHVLGQVGSDGHITGDVGLDDICGIFTDLAVVVSIGDDGAGHMVYSLIVIDADADAGCDTCGGLAQSHAQAGTAGTEVTAVAGKDIHSTGNDGTGDGGLCLMVGDVQCHSCGNLNGAVLRCTAGYLVIAAGSTVDRTLRLGSIGGGAGVGILGTQRIGRGRQTIAGVCLGCVIAGGAITVVIGIVIQAVIDLVGGCVGIVVGLEIILRPGAVGNLVGIVLSSVYTLAELAENTLHVTADGSGKTVAVIFIEGMCHDPEQTVDGNCAVHIHKDIAVHDVDGNRCTDSSLVACRKAAGLGQGAALLNGLEPQADQILALFLCFCQLVFSGLIRGSIGNELLLVEIADVQIVAKRGHAGAGIDVALYIIITEVQGCGCVHRNVLGGHRLRGGGTVAACQTGVVIAGDGIGTGNGNGGSVVGAFSADVQSTGDHGAVCADAGFAGHVAVVQSKRSAHTNRTAVGIGGGSLVDHLLFTGI